eukprot:Pgem_evm1s4749
MTVLQWSRFMFFEREVLSSNFNIGESNENKDHNNQGKYNGSSSSSKNTIEPFTGLENIQIAAATSGRSHLVFG